MQFDHIAISTQNIKATIGFYVSNFIGTEVLYEDATWALLNCGGVKIALVHPDEHPEHITFAVSSREELQFEAAKHQASIKIHRDRSESFYMRDPEGNAVEVVYYP